MSRLPSLEVSSLIFNLTNENKIFEVSNSFEEKEEFYSLEDLEIVGGNFKPEDLYDEIMKPVEIIK